MYKRKETYLYKNINLEFSRRDLKCTWKSMIGKREESVGLSFLTDLKESNHEVDDVRVKVGMVSPLLTRLVPSVTGY